VPIRTRAERLDLALDDLLAGDRPGVEADLRPLVQTASLVHAALPPLPAATRFEERLAARLVEPPGLARAIAIIGSRTRQELRHPSRLLVTGAVSSAAVGVGVTALIAWRGSRRHGSPSTADEV
jgi:hypothetical protein